MIGGKWIVTIHSIVVVTVHMVVNDRDVESKGETNELSRRAVLRNASVTGVSLGVGTTIVPGIVTANTVDTIAFCGCSQVVVYGADMNDGQYTAVLYCGDPPDGKIDCADLTGDAERVNYEVRDEDCKIIGVIGTTNPSGAEPEQTFSVCNEYGPQQCAEKALDEISADDLLECLVSNAQTGSEDTLTVTETYDGSRAEYKFEVSESLTRGDNLEDGDEIDGKTGSGVVRNGDDTFLYKGEIETFNFTKGSTRVLINDQQVNLLCDTDLNDLNIDVRSGGCGPNDPGKDPESPGRGPPDDR